jgi:hypothetical protein
MNFILRKFRTSLVVILAGLLVACGGGGSSTSSNSYPANYTGIDCFGKNANGKNTQENSGIALFFASFYPSVTSPGSGNPVNTIWSTVLSNLAGSTPPTPLILNAEGNFNLQTCSSKYENVTNSVMSLPRNNYGTENRGPSATYDDLKNKIATSLADFVGLDGFYFAAQSLRLTPSNRDTNISNYKSNFTQAQFLGNLNTVCPDGGYGPSGTTLRDLGACANATYMNNFLWKYQGTNGLFSTSGSVSPRFEGVVPSRINGTSVLTWTRGYLLLEYAKAPATTIYTMIIDAGSSGTRINFYRVVGGNGGYPQITLLDSQEFGDNGINDFLDGKGTIDPAAWIPTENDPTGLPNGYSPSGCNMTASSTNGGQADVGPCVIQPLLDSMAGAMSSAGVSASQVKVELFATAGGSYTDAQILNFYSVMRNYANSTKGFAVGNFQTSNGNSQEGIWTWTNLVDQYYNAFGGNTTYYTGSPTVRGNFEVGGSSMQVAFPTSLALGNDNVYNVTINGRSFNVFSKTYLGLGQDDARKFMRAFNY